MTKLPSSSDLPPDLDWWWIFDPRQSLRAAATLSVGAGALLFTLGAAWFAGHTVRQSLQQQAGAGFESLAVQMSDKLDRTIYERYRSLLHTANLDPQRAYSATPAERRRLFAALQDASPDLAWVGLADPQGRVVAATREINEGSSVENRLWFREARQRPHAMGPREARDLPADLLPPEEGEPAPRVLDLAVPVNDPDGRFAGVLAAHLRWGWTREVQQSVIPEALRKERIGVTVYSGNGDVLLDSGGSGWTRPPDTPALPARSFRGNFVEPTSLGTTYLTGYVRSRGFREYRGLGWVVTVRQPVDRAFAPVAEVRHTVARWGFVLSGLGMGLAWWAAGRISRRLRTVARAAGRIENGDVLSVLPSGRGEGEMERMCGALGRMVETLREPKKE